MLQNHSESERKIDAYLMVIEGRILAPIQKTEIQDYCTASLLLLFSAIDGLGKLIHPSPKAGNQARIGEFLAYMGPKYATHKKELIKLRNALVHNAINVASFLSQAKTEAQAEAEIAHLKIFGASGFIYVNTRIMFADFMSAFDRLRADFGSNKAMMKRGASRLEWREEDPYDWGATNIPTTPPPIEFIYAK